MVAQGIRVEEIDGNAPKPPTFRGASLEIQSYTGREWILAGPSETSKTWATLWRLDSLLRETPKAKATLARKLQTSIYSTVLVSLEKILDIRETLGFARPVIMGGNKPQEYIYPNGSRLWVGGMDNPNKILSGERDFIYINQAEELTLQDWEILFTRTTGRGAVTKTPMLFGDCNPGAEDHWIIKRETLKLFHSKHKDNPSLYDEAGNLTAQGERTMATLQSLTGIRKKRLYEGQWVGAEGLFFEEFDPEDGGLHVCEPFPIPLDWPVWLALDYGFAHPTAIGIFTVDGDGKIYLIAEHIERKWLPPLHCRAIRRQAELLWTLDRNGNRVKGLDFNRIKLRVAGHDVFQQRGSTDGRTIADQYEQAVDPETGHRIGFTLDYANTARSMGAQELLTRLGNLAMMIAPTLQIFSTCRKTISCIGRMVTNPKDAEDVLKVDADPLTGEGGDDPYDMLRYGVMTQYREPEPPQESYSRSMFRG